METKMTKAQAKKYLEDHGICPQHGVEVDAATKVCPTCNGTKTKKHG